MTTLNLKGLIILLTVFVLGTGAFIYVNAEQKSSEHKNTEVIDLVHFEFDGNQEPIPIPQENLEENMHPAESNPFSCPGVGTKICSAAYELSDLEQRANGDWVPQSNATPTSVKLYN